MSGINLNRSDLMSLEEAAGRWGLKDTSSIRHRITEFPPGTARKFGKTWVVTKKGMEALYGDEKQER